MSQSFNPSPGDPFGSASGGQSGFGQSGSAGGFGGGFGGGPTGGAEGVSSSTFGSSTFGSGGFGSPSGGGSPRSLTSAPVERLLPSLLLGLIAIGLNIWLLMGEAVATDTGFLVTAVVAWVLSGIVGISLLGGFFVELNARKANGIFTDIAWKKVVLYLTAVVLFIAVVWSAFDIAQFFGKL